MLNVCSKTGKRTPLCWFLVCCLVLALYYSLGNVAKSWCHLTFSIVYFNFKAYLGNCPWSFHWNVWWDGMGWKQTGLRTTVRFFFHGSDPQFRENGTKLLSAASRSCCLLQRHSVVMSVNFYCMCAQNAGIACHVMNCADHENEFKTVRSKNVKRVAPLLEKR